MICSRRPRHGCWCITPAWLTASASPARVCGCGSSSRSTTRARSATGRSRSAGHAPLTSSLLDAFTPAPRIDRPGSDVFLSFTGGTTGLPKGVEYVIDRSVNNTAVLGRLNLGLDDLDWNAAPFDRAVALRRTHQPPVAVPASPMMHSTGLIMASLPVLALGGTVATLTSRSFDADELFRDRGAASADHGVHRRGRVRPPDAARAWTRGRRPERPTTRRVW